MSLDIAAVTAAIAALTVTGVRTIHDLDGALVSINGRECPVIYPAPVGFFNLEEAKQVSMGPSALWQYTYTLNYRYAQGPVGQDRSLAQLLPSAVTGYSNFVQKVAASRKSLGVASVEPANTPEWGVLADASGQQFQAGDILLRIVSFS